MNIALYPLGQDIYLAIRVDVDVQSQTVTQFDLSDHTCNSAGFLDFHITVNKYQLTWMVTQ